MFEKSKIKRSEISFLKISEMLNIYHELNTFSCMFSHLVVPNSLQPHGLQPARLLCPWNSPGKYWSRLPFPPLEDLPNRVIKPGSPSSPTLAGEFLTSEPLGKPYTFSYQTLILVYTYCWQELVLSHLLLTSGQAEEKLSVSRL